MKRSQFIVFFSITIVVWSLIQLYIGFTLVPGVIAPVPGWIGVSLLAVLPIAVMLVGRTNRRIPFKSALEWIGFTAMGLSTLLFVFSLAGTILHMRAWLDPRLVSGGTLLVAGVVTALGVWKSRKPSVVRIEVPIAGLPADLDGFRIVQLSDLHIGPTLKRG